MNGYNVLLPDSSRDMVPELALPAMDALQQLGHTPVTLDMHAMAELYREMRYNRHGGYELFLFYAKDIVTKGNIDFALSFGLTGVLEDPTKRELHYLPEEFRVPGLLFTHGRQAEALDNLLAAGAATWQTTTVCCSSHSYATALRSAGVARVSVLPLGYSQRVFYPQHAVPANAAFPLKLDDGRLTQGFTVSFAGQYSPFRAEVLGPLAEAGVSLAVFGDARWEQTPLSACYRGALHRLADLNTLYNSSVINLDLPHDADWSTDYVSARVVECLGSGSFLLALEQPGLGAYAASGSELAVCADAGELLPCIQHWLAAEDERRAIAAAGEARVRREASWASRLKQALAALEVELLVSVG